MLGKLWRRKSYASATTEALERLIAVSAQQSEMLGRKLDQIICATDNLTKRLVASAANQTDLLNQRLAEAAKGSANQTDVLNQRLAEIVSGNANQTDLLNQRLAEIISGSANQTDLLNRRLGEVVDGSSHQTELFNCKIEAVIVGIANLADLFNRKLDDIASTRGLSRLTQGSAERSVETTQDDMASGVPDRQKLKVICVGTGRDGSSSLAQMIAKLSELTGIGYQVSHEYKSRELFDIFCEYRETGDRKFLDTLNGIIAQCPHDCIVGAGYATLLPMFAEQYGPQLKLVHLRRADRARCVESIKENAELFPAAYRYYHSSSAARYRRIAAFHFGEMDRDRWDRLSTDEKLGWYFDKTHSLVDQHTALFANHLAITTESMNDEPTRRALAKLIVGDDSVLPPPVVANPHYLKPGTLPPRDAEIAQWMLQDMDTLELGKNGVYLLEYAVSRVHQFITAAMESEIYSPNEVPTDGQSATIQKLDRAGRALLGGLDRFADLRDRLKPIRPLPCGLQSSAPPRP